MIYHFGECTLDTQVYSVQRGGQSIRLRPKVFRMCLYLLEHRDRVVSREELCAQLWPGRFVNPGTLEGVIRSLRQALGDSARAQGITLTRHSYGYRFVADVQERPAEGAVRSVGLSAPSLGSTALTHRDREPQPLWAIGWPGAAPQRGQRRGITVGLVVVLLTLGFMGGWGLWQGLRDHLASRGGQSRSAVMPFIDLSAEANQASFADGITQELIAQLAQKRGLTVIARTAVMKYKGTLKDVATVGPELRVARILQGSVRTIDKQMRISAEFIDVPSQGYLWSEEYDREVLGVSTLKSDIASLIAQGLNDQLTATEKCHADLPTLLGKVSF